ncbi:MAG: hypothetical protein V4808_07495 [Pseudomonadota bacterium]
MLKLLAIALPLFVASTVAGAPSIGARATAHSAGIARDGGRSAERPPVLGANGYIEYFPGNAPIIITAPHGGSLMPESIPTRADDTCGGKATIVTDRNTLELAKQIRESFFKRYGKYPHVIVSHLSRKKLDANRPLEEATCGSAEAAQAFGDWHRFIETAKADVMRDFGKGWFMDIHGHGHDIPRVEIGYLLKADSLNLSDAAINADPALRDQSSIRTAGAQKNVPLAELLRGPNALGSLFQRTGFRAVPSDKEPGPEDAKYFSAGYNTLRYGCSAGASRAGGDSSGAICGVQFETHYKGLRDTAANRERFGDATAVAVGDFLRRYFDLDLAK